MTVGRGSSAAERCAAERRALDLDADPELYYVGIIVADKVDLPHLWRLEVPPARSDEIILAWGFQSIGGTDTIQQYFETVLYCIQHTPQRRQSAVPALAIMLIGSALLRRLAGYAPAKDAFGTATLAVPPCGCTLVWRQQQRRRRRRTAVTRARHEAGAANLILHTHMPRDALQSRATRARRSGRCAGAGLC
jgi:hypothetical protein